MADSAFTADWLALRNAVDTAARDAALVQDLAAYLAPKRELRVLDLGAGSGANLRYLAPKLNARQHWRLVDSDQTLLAQATKKLPTDVEVETQQCDLARDLDRLDMAGVDLVTASALMDLVSAAWFDSLAEHCRKAGAVLYIALTYDGIIDFAPSTPDDDLVRELVNQHQQSDKSFGPALGPSAPDHMETTLRALGYEVRNARSDWRLGPDDAVLQEALLDGYVAAARELRPSEDARLRTWLERRQAEIAKGTARLTVGHRDLIALS